MVAYILAMAASIIISRTLGPAGRGSYYVLVTVASTALSLGHFSIEQAQVFLWPTTPDKRSLAANSMVMGFFLGLISSGVALGIVTLLGPRLVPLAGRGLLLIALAAVPAGITSLYANGLLVLQDRIGRVNLGVLLSAITQTGLIVLIAANGRLTVSAVVVIWAITTAVPLLITLPTLRASIKSFSMNLATRAMSLGLRYHLGMISVFLLFRSDVFILNALVDKTRVGLYSLAVTLAELLFLVTDSIAQVMLPRQVAVSIQESALLTTRVVRINFVVAAAAVLGVVIASPVAIPLLFGKAFTGSIPALIALSGGVVALATIRPAGGYLIRLNRPLLVAGASVVALAVNVVLNVLLIPMLGIVGAGVASTIAYSLLATFQLIWMIRSSGLPVRSLIPRVADFRDPLVALLRSRGDGLG